MNKSRIKPVKSGRNIRMSYSRQKEVLEMPNLIEVQKNSYDWFLKKGLKEVFEDISPITDYSGHLSLEFTDFSLCEVCRGRDFLFLKILFSGRQRKGGPQYDDAGRS